MSFRLPRVYPLTDASMSRLSHAEQVRRLAAGGASIIQMREKRMAGRELFVAAKDAFVAARETGVRLIINDRVDLALAVGADGVHLGQDDLPPAQARAILGPHAIIGLSTHSVAQATEALRLPIDYMAIGPIFPTATKKDTAAVLGLTGLAKVRKAVSGLPLVAIGGITAANASEVVKAGADCVALVSCLLSNPQTISEQMAALLQTL